MSTQGVSSIKIVRPDPAGIMETVFRQYALENDGSKPELSRSNYVTMLQDMGLSEKALKAVSESNIFSVSFLESGV
jgi:hypothetical protein